MMSIFLHRQKGISLVSLMVAVAIGIFLVGAVLKIYLDSKNSFNTRNVVAEISENQRFALDDMRRILVMTGRGIRAIEDRYPNRRAFAAVAAGGIVDGGGTASDTIAIRYRRGPSCGAYQNVPAGTTPSMVRFFVNNNDLVCELTTYNPTNTTTRTLVSGVQMLKALYGVDDDNDGYADRYLSAATIENPAMVSVPSGANTAWARVVSMRIALLAGSQSELPPSARKPVVENLSVLGVVVAEPDTEHLYKVASTTLSLRNLNAIIQRQ